MLHRRVAALLLACAACHHARDHKAELVIEIRAQFPGAGPAEVAASVTSPLEDQLSMLPHIAALTSESTEGMTRVRVTFDRDDLDAARQAIQLAITNVTPRLPATMAGPPTYAVMGAPAGRFLISHRELTAAAEHARMLPGVGFVEMCGGPHFERSIVLDAQRLVAAALTVTDVIGTLRSADSRLDLGGVLLAARNGVPVLVRDVARVEDTTALPDCQVFSRWSDLAELVVDAQHGANVDAVHAAVVHEVAGVLAVPQWPELHAQLAADVDIGRAAGEIREVLARVDGACVVELRGRNLTIVDDGGAGPSDLRKLPGVARGGDATSVVHVTGADTRAIATTASAIADRLRQADMLVATHGLATTTTLQFEVDRQRAADLGVAASDIETTLAAATGGTATNENVVTHAPRLVIRVQGVDPKANGLDTLYVRSVGEMLVPLASVVKTRETTGPTAILHRGRLPDVALDVRGDPTTAIGAVPAGIRVEVVPYP